MSTFRKLSAAAIVLFLILAAALDIFLLRSASRDSGAYRVEAKRLTDRIEETGSTDISDFPHLTGVFTGGDLYRSDEHYLIIEAGGETYRVEYTVGSRKGILIAANLVMGALFLLLIGLLYFIRKHIVVPFGRLNKVPQELARGNLAVPIPEEKSRFFGKFTWGVNLLREKIEDDRQKELSMQRDKKLLLLSLSHDIKTPLSAIKLNAKALAKGLYKDEEKRRSTAESIDSRADEIEQFVSEITKAASEDFMNFEVTEGEVFLSSVISKLSERYAPQLSVSGTEFRVGSYDDCLLACDPDRLAECLQNLVENAIKYSDGREIGLSFDKMDGCQLITVYNTGCSLEEKELPQIFESFHRGTNADKVQGNGLGLFICKRLMSLMGGEVFAEIKEDKFCITLVVRLA
ncbi:sensor histidine kinase [Ruminococcus flavefaciens]|uniref:sensor histidine kinase n=1 Tax=Ruminococcus flavefaciens TaxID=1265 RepID=UPI00048C60BE|nr:HAMP domain-containing sensor histidine kinase [Ruminococcus flavefaciens]